MHQNRYFAVDQNALGFAAQQNADDALAPVRGHADQVALAVLCLLHGRLVDGNIHHSRRLAFHALGFGDVDYKLQTLSAFFRVPFSNSAALYVINASAL